MRKTLGAAAALLAAFAFLQVSPATAQAAIRCNIAAAPDISVVEARCLQAATVKVVWQTCVRQLGSSRERYNTYSASARIGPAGGRLAEPATLPADSVYTGKRADVYVNGEKRTAFGFLDPPVDGHC